MKFCIISHRGNINGPIESNENNPDYIDAARKKGYDVEVDVWVVDSVYYLGHDYPKFKVDKKWFENRKSWVWCHAKNFEALKNLINDKFHCFWHENDKLTLTSKNIFWCYPGNFIENGIAVLPEKKICFQEFLNLKNKVAGVCTDYPSKFL